MTTIREILAVKGRTVHTIGPRQTVFEAVRSMSDNNVGSLLVVDGERIVGIITERDYLREVILKDRSSKNTAVEEIMSRDVCIADPDDDIQSVMAVMTSKRCRHLPIVSPRGLEGLVSIGDLVKQLVNDREAEIKHLEDYIKGRYPG